MNVPKPVKAPETLTGLIAAIVAVIYTNLPGGEGQIDLITQAVTAVVAGAAGAFAAWCRRFLDGITAYLGRFVKKTEDE